MTGACHRAAVAAVAAVLLSVALRAAAPAAAAATTALAVGATPVNEASVGDTVSSLATTRIRCDYNLTNRAYVEAPCGCNCGVGRQYRVKQRISMWVPGTPQTEPPLYYLDHEFLCTPTRALAGAARSGKAGRRPLTCMSMGFPTFEELCVHAPATPGCGWETPARLSWQAVAAINGGVSPPFEQYITQCPGDKAMI